ncbi:MAG: T9SS type A sorting domain-containing protein, partial [Flavobacteriales bacterium]|nr:T9SS type A sorting domain-containing protein [Flavobacteriales bacterium]
DGESQSYLDEYESNLYHLVNDIRYQFDSPEMAVVIANSGHGGFEASSDPWVQDMQNIVSVAQEAVGCNDTLYGGTVGFVETKQYYLDETLSPDNAIHHFHNNALTFLNIGKDLGKEMVMAINDMAFCYVDCENQIAPGVVSIGNRVWNDYDQDGFNDPDEPGIPGVSVVLWGDSDGDEIPDWQGFGGVQVTDENGYYNFSGLVPGNYVVFVWSVDNWGPGEPLEGFMSTNGFVADADNDVDNDNNGSGNPFTDIMSGIVTLSSDDEPLNDGDPFNCYFNYDGSGNNTIDFGFYDPNQPPVGIEESQVAENDIEISPNPARDEIRIRGIVGSYQIDISDAAGRLSQRVNAMGNSKVIDVSTLPVGLYFVHVISLNGETLKVKKLVIE